MNLLDLNGDHDADEFLPVGVDESPFHLKAESRVEFLDLEALCVFDWSSGLDGAVDTRMQTRVVVVEGIGQGNSGDDSVSLNRHAVGIHLRFEAFH